MKKQETRQATEMTTKQQGSFLRKSLLFMFFREVRLINNMRFLWIMVFIYPILIAGILFSIFHKESITRLPIAIVDQDHSVLSRNLIQKVAAVPEILVAQRYNNLSEAKESLLKGDIYGLILIPPRFEEELLANKQPEVTGFYNNQFMTIGNTLNRAMSSAFTGLISEIQISKMAASNIPSAIAKTQLSPISLEIHGLFNPTLNYIYTLLNGVYPTILQIILMLAITASMHKERERDPNLQRLMRMSGNSIWAFIINKCSVYFVVGFLFQVLFDSVMIGYFNLPIRGNLLVFLAGDILFIMTCLLMGFAFTLILDDKLQNYSAIGILTSPAFGFTGLIFPKLVMNGFAQVWGCIIPVTWYIQIRLDQSLRGLSFLESLKPFLILLIMTGVSLGVIAIYSKKIIDKKEQK